MTMINDCNPKDLVQDLRVTGCTQELFEQAYQDAKDVITAELGLDKGVRFLLDSKASIYDVQQELSNAQKTYQSDMQCKTRKWLVALSERITHYGAIFDVLVQHHPEYVSLAWGTFKFVFIAVLNQQEIIKKLSKGLSHIADVLPRANLTLVLYPTEMMQQALARLYAHIIQVLLQAMQWYRQGKLKHSFTAIFRPWQITFHDHLEAIKDDSVRLDRFSDMAMKAELRDTHVEIIEARKDWANTQSELQIMRVENQRLANVLVAGLDRLDTTMISMHRELSFDFRGQVDMLCTVQLNQILSMPFLEKLPTSGESLEYCQSIGRRSRHRMRLQMPDVSRLEEWASEPVSSLLVLQGTSSVESKTFMIDLIRLVRESRLPIIWAVRYPNYWDSPSTCIDILRMLILQTLQINPQALAQGSHRITVAHMREAATEQEWLAIFVRALQGIPRVFLALDSEYLAHVTANDRHQATNLVESLRSALPGTVKILASACNLEEAYVASRQRVRQCINLNTHRSGSQNIKQRRRGKITKRQYRLLGD